MKMLALLVLSFVSLSVLAQEPMRDTSTETIENVALKNAEIEQLLRSSRVEINRDTPNYSLAMDNLEEAKAMCYALSCRANKLTCSEIFKVSGLVSYLQYEWVPTIVEIKRKYTKEEIVMLKK